VRERVRDGGDELVVPGFSSDERHVGDPARLVEVAAATLLGGGLVPTALLRDVHGARDRRACQREAGRGCGLLGQRSACDQEPYCGGGEQQDRPKVRQSHRWRIAVMATSS
jgi:hypothetical protein